VWFLPPCQESSSSSSETTIRCIEDSTCYDHIWKYNVNNDYIDGRLQQIYLYRICKTREVISTMHYNRTRSNCYNCRLSRRSFFLSWAPSGVWTITSPQTWGYYVVVLGSSTFLFPMVFVCVLREKDF
jgi:hypothetical protein